MRDDPVINLLSPQDQARLRAGAKAAQQVERRFTLQIADAFRAIETETIEAMMDGREPPTDIDLEGLLLENAFAAMQAAFDTQPRVPSRFAKPKTGKPPSFKIPSNPRELRIWWDKVRKGKAPRRIQSLATRIKAAYLQKVQELWVEHGEAFRRGDEWTQAKVRTEVKKAVAVGRQRGNMIVATETTRYYNQARRSFYDQQPTVTHYLYVAVRDKRTTKWCKPKIGRDGIVYSKDSEFLKRETPPCFLGGTPVLTHLGWQPIATVKVGDYVYTAQGNWRRVTDVHCTFPGMVEIFQIGYGLATSNHPYLTRSGEYAWANEIRAQEGVCAISFNLPGVWEEIVATVQSVENKNLLQLQMPFFDRSAFESRSCELQMERWIENTETWICRNIASHASRVEPTRLRFNSPFQSREANRALSKAKRSSTPYRWEQKEQLYRESAIDVEFRARCIASSAGWINTTDMQTNVYNLEVEIDETYCAGGFFVHNCHYNCRSELLPLSPFNPNHKKLIENKSRRRENRRPAPLLPGWNT